MYNIIINYTFEKFIGSPNVGFSPIIQLQRDTIWVCIIKRYLLCMCIIHQILKNVYVKS